VCQQEAATHEPRRDAGTEGCSYGQAAERLDQSESGEDCRPEGLYPACESEGAAIVFSIPLISLCHTTARLPDGWRMAAASWRGFCDRPELVEHIIATDTPLPTPSERFFHDTRFVINHGRRCAVDGWNAAARESRGKLLISVSDDWFPPLHWDTLLLERIAAQPDGLDGEYVIEVSTGGNNGLLTFSILTREYFHRINREYGYAGLFAPDYLGMYGDDDFTMFARRDGVVIDATDLYFHHDHPLYTGGEMDATHQWQHRPEAFKVGAKAYRRRRRQFGFPRELRRNPVIAVCFPGDIYRAEWMVAWTHLVVYLAQRAMLLPLNSYSSDPHITRASLAEAVNEISPVPDLVLWIDDDNPVFPEHFARLLETLLANPDLDATAGWCWTQHDGRATTDTAHISCGLIENGIVKPFTMPDLFRGADPVRRVDYTGFPVVLMHAECLEFSDRPFTPIVNPALHWGKYGEDVSFWMRSGAKVAVDRRVEVEHLKWKPDRPLAATISDCSTLEGAA
jgi:hypothetical protein